MANGFRTPRSFPRGETVNIDTGSLEQNLYKVSLATGIIDARAFGGTEDVNVGPTKEQMITAAIQYAIAVGASAVLVPKSMRPYNAAAVTFNNAVLILDEGLDTTTVNVFAYGAKGDGITDDTVAIQTAINVALATKVSVYFPGTTQFYRCLSGLTWPAGVDLRGDGPGSMIKFDGAIALGLNGNDPGTSHAQSGVVDNLVIAGTNGVVMLVSVTYRSQPRFRRTKITGATQQGLFFSQCIMPQFTDESLILACGDATHAQLEVVDSTTFTWRDSYMSTGNANVIAGLAIDKTSSFTIQGGAIESTGIPIRLGGKADNLVGVNSGIIGPIDLENPNGTADCYIEMGAGWTGAQYQGVTRVTVTDIQSTPSGSTTVKFGIKAQNTDTITLLPNKWGILSFAAGGIAAVELVGLNNIRWSSTPQSSLLGVSLLYVRENAVVRPDALPYTSWEQGGRNLFLSRATSFAQNSATPDASGASFISTNSTLATTITNITGGHDVQVLAIFAGDNNTTLKHNNGGVGNIVNPGAVDWLLTSGEVAVFIYDVSSTSWRPAVAQTTVIGPRSSTLANILVSAIAGTVSFIAQGAAALININLTPKGAGAILANISSQFAQFRIGSISGGNFFDIFPNVSGSPPNITVDGTDADIDLKLSPKGAGMVNINLPATIANGGGAVPTLGTIGGSGPTGAAAVGWLKIKVNGSVRFLQLWA